MILVPQMPEKVQYLLHYSFPQVAKLCEKTNAEKFVGGRPGVDKEKLFMWLLIKKVTNWDYRTIASMAGVSHPTLIKANELFLKKHVYGQVMRDFVKQGYKLGLIRGKYVAMDSSFVHTFSRHGEVGSEGWNEFKEGYGFKLHLLIDTETKFPIALCITNGLAHDMTLAIPLLKKARPWLRRCGYVLADKGYDWGDIVNWVVKKLNAKAGIPIRRVPRGKNYSVGSSNKKLSTESQRENTQKKYLQQKVSN